ncbi:hypothetical protein AAC387_Pa11g1911 [Persea americana]
MAFFSATLSFHSFCPLSPLPLHLQTKAPISTSSISIPRANAAEPDKETIVQKSDEEPPKPKPPSSTTARPKKPVYSMKKGQIVRVDKEKYLNSVNYLSVGHPPYFKGLDYIYEDRGEVLDIRIFETGEYALIAWVGIPTAPAWLPTDMLIKSDKLDYERF